MLKLLFLLLLLLKPASPKVVHSDLTMCPVSQMNIRFNESSYYYYPIDIYNHNHTEGDVISCAAYDDMFCRLESCQPLHYCPINKTFCPLVKENIIQSMHRASQASRSSICILKEKLMKNNENINVYVSGGSVTIGSFAGGCCSADGCISRTSEACSWSYRFTQWLNTTFPATVKYFNIGERGRSSVFMVDELATRLASVKAKPFTSSDIIFFDHSVNDNSGGSDTSGYAVENAMEILIRRVYFYSENQSLPTIIILDADPRPRTNVERYPYYEAYEKVGKHYNVPVWSYRDMALSHFSSVHQRHYVSFLNFTSNFIHGTHPGWPIHLFMADLYASIFQHDSNRWCDLSDSNNKAMYDTHLQQRRSTFAELPTPLSVNASFICDQELLSLSYDIVKQNLNPVGTYRFEPERAGWNLSVDKVGRTGGFIVTKEADAGAKVVFSMNISTTELVQKRIKFQLFLHFLRSYDNGGMCNYKPLSSCINDEHITGVVRVSVCNHAVQRDFFRKTWGYLDGRWEDYRTHRFSLPDRWAPDVNFFPYTLCTNFSEAKPTVEVTFHKGNDPERGNQKFKLMNIKVCRVTA